MLFRFILLIALVIAADVAIVITFLRNPSPATVPVLLAAGFGVVVVVALLAFHMIWRPIFSRYPAQRPSLDAVSRRFQSFSVSIVNLGFSINASADEDFLHLEPLWIWQALGATPASVPWSAMTPERRSLLARDGCSVRIDGHLLVGPRWCFERVFARSAREGTSR